MLIRSRSSHVHHASGQRLSRLASLVVGLCAASCGRGPNEVRHPTPDNLPADGSPVVSSSGFPGDLRGVGLEEWVALREALAGSETLATIGTLGETGDDGPQVFGWAADAKFDADGNVLILGRLSQDVRVFDVAGRFLSGSSPCQVGIRSCGQAIGGRDRGRRDGSRWRSRSVPGCESPGCAPSRS